jgi:hypothetical protein
MFEQPETPDENKASGDNRASGMDDASLLGVIEQFEQESYGFASGELQQERAYAIERYLGLPYGDEVEGRSSVVSTDLRDTVEWILPQILRVFLSGDEVVKFQPSGPEDERAAKLETEYINYVILERNDAFNVFSTWFRDALISKVGYVKAYWQQRDDVRKESYRGKREDELAIILADPSVELVGEPHGYPDPYAPPPPPMPAPQAMGMGQGPMSPPPAPMLYDFEVRRVFPCGHVKIDNVPPEEIYIHRSLRTVGLEDCLFIQHRTRKTLSEAKQDGLDIPDDVGSEQTLENDEIVTARDRFQDSDWQNDTNSKDPATRQVWIRESYLRVDVDGDGIAELRKVISVGRHVLVNEETDLIPFAAVTPIVFPHRHVGIGFDDLTKMPGEVNTVLKRQYIDNLFLANNGRYGVDVNMVNVDDLLQSRPGGIVRTNGNPAMGIMPIVHPQVGATALEGMNMVQQWLQMSTGVAADQANMSADVLQKTTATAISQVVSAGQARVEAVTRSFAAGMKDLFQIVHALTLKNATSDEKVKLNNEWQAVDPREWVKRTNMQIVVGLGSGTKESRIAMLMQLAQLQAQGMQAKIVTPVNLYHTGMRITEEMGYKNSEEFWTDPAKAPPEPPQPSPEEKAAQVTAQGLIQQEQVKQQGADNRLPQELESKRQIALINAGKDMLIAAGAQAIDLKEATAKVAHKFTELHMDNAHRAGQGVQDHAFKQQQHADQSQFQRDTFQPKT